MVSPLENQERSAFEGYIPTKESIATTAGNTLPALLAFTALGQKALQGAFYSAGGEPFIADSRFGAVVAKADQSIDDLVRFRNATISLKKDGFIPKARFINAPDVYTRGIDRKLAVGGLQPMHTLNIALPIAMTAYGAVSAYSEGGFEGLRDFAVQDVFANYYGMQAATTTFSVTDVNKASKALDIIKGGVGEITKVGQEVSVSRAFAGSPMLGRIVPILGGYIGAAMGMGLGSTIGEQAAGLYNMQTGANVNEDLAGFVGGIFGAAGGAAVGAAMLSSFKSAVVSTVGLAATKIFASTQINALQAGFQNINNRRQGLNFASDVSAHFTNNAVTMRQRAVQAMHKSHMNARSAFGQEASLVHMNRDYFSHYKR